jgi:hypothetical protein
MSEVKKMSNLSDYTQSVTIDTLSKIIFINYLELHNPELYATLIKIEKPEEQIIELKKVIDIGTFVKSKVEMVMDTDYVDLQIKKMTENFLNGVEVSKDEILSLVQYNFDPSKTDSYTNQINQFFLQNKNSFVQSVQQSLSELNKSKELLTKSLNDSLNPDLKSSHMSKVIGAFSDFESNIVQLFDLTKQNSITSQFKTLLENNLGANGQFLKLVEKKLSFDNPDSTISQLQKNIQADLSLIRQEIASIKTSAETSKAIIDKTPQKGFEFEEQLLLQLESFASVNGDIVEDLSKTSGSTLKSKKGDFNYTVSSLKKVIAFEAKNRDAIATPATLIKEMAATKTNRNADYVIYITASENQLHKQIGQWQEYDNDKLVTHLGLWQVALKVAIARMKMESVEIENIDRTAFEQEIQTISTALKNMKIIKSASTNIINEANKISSQAEEIKNQITNSLTNLNLLVSLG